MSLDSDDKPFLDIEVSKWLSSLRDAAGLSQEALASQIGKSQSYIAKIESGAQRILLQDAIEWAGALCVTPKDFSRGVREIYKQTTSVSMWKVAESHAGYSTQQTVNQDLREAVRQLHLPLAPDNEEGFLQDVSRRLVEMDIDLLDQPEAILYYYDVWKSSGDPPVKLLKSLLPASLLLSEINYFDLHRDLRQKQYMTFRESSLLLSHIRLISRLAKKERMTAAKIAKLLCSMDSRLTVTWRNLKPVLAVLKLVPSVELDQMQELYHQDGKTEEVQFADASLEECTAILKVKADGLRFPIDLACQLDILVAKETRFEPYLQILLFQCSILKFYDHVPSVLYEFSPRGRAAQWLFEQFSEAGIHVAGNPVLNNAKSVEVLNFHWAQSKKADKSLSSLALARIIWGLDQMSFCEANELSVWIRRWVHRFIRLQAAPEVKPPSTCSEAQIRALVSNLSEKQSQSSGIIEQRVVDGFAAALHLEKEGWRSRGLVDSVNTSNLSRKKIGDCDFQHPESRTITAYEAHGGKLTQVYLDSHLHTLHKVIPFRQEEMEGIAPIGEWTVNIVFVAHSFQATTPDSFQINGLPILIEFLSFKDFLRPDNIPHQLLEENFCKLITPPIFSTRCPTRVREKFMKLLVL